MSLKICFVVDDVVDNFFLKGLAAKGVEITLLSIDPSLKKPSENITNIRFCSLKYAGPPVSTLSPALQSYYVLQWLLDNTSTFDVIHFPLAKGVAYYTLLAKHQGLAFASTRFFIECRTSNLWKKDQNHEWIDHIDDLAIDFLERESARLSDEVIIREKKLLDWMEEHAWQLPEKVLICGDERTFQELLTIQKPTESILKEVPFQPLVSVCVTHFNRSEYLAQALDSIRSQDYPHFEVIIVDDASTKPEAIAFLDKLEDEFRAKQWKIIRNPKNIFPGAARNVAVRHSRGEYLLFMDDDNYGKPNQISTFIQVAGHTQADILTCAMDVFMGTEPPTKNHQVVHRFLPMGAAASVGLYLNMFGDMNALIKKEAYEALGGLTEERGIGGEDWELYSRAVLQGYHLETIPCALFWYRDTPSSITKSTHLYANSLRAIQSYLHSVPAPLRVNLILSQAQQDKLQQLIRDHNNIGKLLRRCLHLFISRAKRALSNPRKIVHKFFKI